MAIAAVPVRARLRVLMIVDDRFSIFDVLRSSKLEARRKKTEMQAGLWTACIFFIVEIRVHSAMFVFFLLKSIWLKRHSLQSTLVRLRRGSQRIDILFQV